MGIGTADQTLGEDKKFRFIYEAEN